VKKLWAKWKAFAQIVGDFQARILLTLIYFIIVTPFGVLVRVLSDPLKLKHTPHSSTWFPKPAEGATLENARRQF
jgi:hypothetical protein